LELTRVVSELNRYFHADDVRGDSWEDLFDIGYGDVAWREALEPGYMRTWNGLMVRGKATVGEVVTCVFPSAAIIDSLAPGALLFTEHPLDLVDEVFTTIDLGRLAHIRRDTAGIYQVHAPLDHHPQVSPSRLLARALLLSDLDEYFPVAEGIPGGALVIGNTDATLLDLVSTLRLVVGLEVPVNVHSEWRSEAGRVAIAAGGGAQTAMLAASIERGCRTYVTGNALSDCPLPGVRQEIDAFAALAAREKVSVVDATHYGTEKLPQLEMVKWFSALGLEARFAPGVPERRDS
jgi:putative NIF3 family GTP cyclohydrolase 1 type 2